MSPAGHSFIANDRIAADGTEKNMSTRCYAIKRMICDNAIVEAAILKGVALFEQRWNNWHDFYPKLAL